jgi:hypothetical protein
MPGYDPARAALREAAVRVLLAERQAESTLIETGRWVGPDGFQRTPARFSIFPAEDRWYPVVVLLPVIWVDPQCGL